MRQELGIANSAGLPVVLRGYTAQDAAALVVPANDRSVMAYMHDADQHEYTLPEAEAWVRFVMADQPDLHLLLSAGAEVVGGVSLARQRDIYSHSAEISYWVTPAWWGRGLATRAVAAASEHAFWTLGLERLYARVFLDNPASLRVLEHNSFVREGLLRAAVRKHGRLHDQALFARLRTDEAAAPSQAGQPRG